MNRPFSFMGALRLIENVCCYVTSNDILITRIHITIKVSLTRPANETWKEKIREMIVKHFINHCG